AVRYLLPKLDRPLDGQLLADVCASFQQAVIDVLLQKIMAAAQTCSVKLITLSGGVSCNCELSSQLEQACSARGLNFLSAPHWLSTDNAAMIAFAASLNLDRELTSPVTQEINPNLALA